MSSSGKGDTPSTSSPAAGEPYVLEYSVESPEAVGPELRRDSSKLIVRSDRREAFLEKHRSQSDRRGEPIGTFRAELDDGLAARILDEANRMLIPEPPAAGAGDEPGPIIVALKFEQGARKVTRAFTTGDMATLNAMRELLSELNQLSGQLNSHPKAALQASVHYEEGETPHFVLTLTNIGTEPICFADPRFLPPGDPDHWAGAQVAELPEEKPDVTPPPLEWTRLLLDKPAEPAPEAPVVLEPGKSFSAKTVRWQNVKPKVRFLALGVYSDYTGPGEIADVYRVRGATFSEGLEFEPK